MSDKDVGDALLNLDLSAASRPSAGDIDRIIEADRRRVHRLTRIAVGLWIAAALGALVIFVGSGFVFPLIAKLVQQAGEGNLNQPDTPFLVLAKLTAMCVVVGSVSFLVLVFAGLMTVLLVFRSRRATLYQINANLLGISEQLKGLAGRKPEGGTAT